MAQNLDRFKFRCWYSHYNKMYYDGEDMAIQEIRWNSSLDIYLQDVICMGNDSIVEIMQCTGHKDSNGHLIYEGDVLKFPSGLTGQVVWEDDPPGLWVRGDYVCIKENWKVFKLSYRGTDPVYIIGNIYENPELLDG